MIKSVEHGLVRPDATNKIDPRLKGIQNSLKMIDHLSSHISKMQTDIGVQSRRFDDTIARNEMLLVHTNELKSDIEDTDLAEASMRLQQNSLGYQAMLQTIQKMNGLSLVNYMR
jgi:flagellar hook-associated protein 3 FlgL